MDKILDQQVRHLIRCGKEYLQSGVILPQAMLDGLEHLGFPHAGHTV